MLPEPTDPQAAMTPAVPPHQPDPAPGTGDAPVSPPPPGPGDRETVGPPDPAANAPAPVFVVNVPPPSPPDSDRLLGSNFAPTLTATHPPTEPPDPTRTVTLRTRLDDLIDRTLGDDPTHIAEGYRLVARIGAGTFGTVWEAEDLQTGERVAIKFFAVGDAVWERMLEEVKVLQAVEGSHGIVMVKQVRRGGPGRPPYYVMQLARGGSLAARLEEYRARRAADPETARRPGPVVPVGEAVRLFNRVVQALAFVHRRGIHHCDLKPANILLNEAGEPLIADFGQAHLASDVSPALGTFFYMAPEQATLTPVPPDTRWDVYALGAILYEMLTGDRPRKDEAALARLRAAPQLAARLEAYREGIAAAPPPTAHRKLADPMLARLVDRCLALDPDARPRDAGAVLELLGHRSWWARTKPILVLGTAATFVFVLFVAAVSLIAARLVYQDARASVTREVQGGLAREAWFGRQALESTLREQVRFVEQEAADCPAEVRSALAAAGNQVRAARLDAEATGDRTPFRRWLGEAHARRGERATGVGSMGLILAVDGRAFYAARVRRDGSFDDPEATANPTVYRDDWSFRDYFNGTGNRFAERGRPHPPITATHISHTYQSQADDRPWKVDISTPVTARPDNRGPVVGVLVFGVDLRAELVARVEPPADRHGDDLPAVREVEGVLVNDRGAWVWHARGMRRLEERLARGDLRDPDSYRELCARLGGPRADADRACGWLDDPGGGRSDNYVDAVEWDLTGRPRALLAYFEPLYPYRDSRYPELRGRRWVYVAQLDAEAAVRPVVDLRRKMMVAGSSVVATLAGLAVGLWYWLIRVLRGREFRA